MKENISTDGSSLQGAKSTEALLTDVLAKLEEVRVQNKKLQRRMTWIVVGNYLQLLLVLVPLIAALIFLPPVIRQVTSSFSQMGGGSVQSSVQDILELLR